MERSARPGLSVRRPIAILATLVLAFATLVFAETPEAFAAPEVTLSKSADGQVLAGEPITFTLAASNPKDNPEAVPEYNLTFRDVLPPGLDYVPGSTTPSEAGDPQVITDPDTGQTTLIWSNVADLQPGDSFTLSFQAVPDPDEFEVGATADNAADVYATTDPRQLPRFDAEGIPIDGTFTETNSSSSSTLISAIEVTKSEPSPEGELLRGVHDNTTVYTLRVENNDLNPTEGVVLVDYIPAAIEFLGCGGVDNTTGQTPEYDGAPTLVGTPTPGGCVDATSVETVANPPADGGATLPGGVYTKVTWDLGTLAPGDVVTINYAAGVPLFANTTDWPNGEPTPDSLGQAANLDNNTGASTRETDVEIGATNTARVSGTYTGPVAEGSSPDVESIDEESVQIEDVRMRKSVDPGTFTAGGVATYTLVIDVSEYVDAGPIEITDVIPNGLCPIDDQQNYEPDQVAECAPVGNPPTISPAQPGFGFDSVVEDADGFDVTFTPITEIPANGTVTITYEARMRTDYRPATFALGPPTSNEDTFTNNVDLTATTTPIPESPETGTEEVGDSSSATLTGSGLVLDKSILPRSQSGETCGTDGAGYGEASDFPPDETQFGQADQMCFKVRVDFSDKAATRAPVIGDFLPAGTSYVPGSMTLTTNNTVLFVEFNEADASAGTSPPVWELGEVQVDGNKYVGAGRVFEAVLAATVDAAATGPEPDLTGNLVKMRTEDREGNAQSYRDEVPVVIIPAPPLELLKGVAEVDDPADGPNGPDVDGSEVREQSVATFRIDITNEGSVENANADPVRDIVVWDVLPEEIDCSLVEAISDGGVCTDPGDPGHPTFAGNDQLSAITWTVPGPLQPGESLTITYDMVIPDLTPVDFQFDNTAYVRSYEAFTNGIGETVEYFTQNNPDTTVPAEDQLAPEASDPSFVRTPTVVMEKSGTTSIVETNNNEPNQAVVGELVDYTYGVTVPARTTIFEGVLTDSLPAGLVLQNPPEPVAEFYPDADSDATAPLPDGFLVDPDTGALTFPDVWDNTSQTDQRFVVTVQVLVTPEAIPPTQNRRNVTNTARFNSKDAVGGTPLQEQRETYQVQLRQPQPTLDKQNTVQGQTVVGGDQIGYSLDVSLPAGDPPLHDAWIVDCVPAGVDFLAYEATPYTTLPPESGDGTNGCPAGTTRLAWGVGTIEPDQTLTVAYLATVSPDVAGGETYTNTATLAGSSLDDGKTDPTEPDNPNERGYSVTDTSTIEINSGTAVKTVNPRRATVGERVTFTITDTVPPDVNFYQVGIVDTLPRGLDPDTIEVLQLQCFQFDLPIACNPGLDPTPLTPVTNPDGSTTLGASLGDLLSDPDERVIVLRYSVAVDDLDGGTFPAAGDMLVNRAAAAWDTQDSDEVPDSVDYPWERTGTELEATVTVVEPDVSIDKTVSNSSPEPGEEFNYEVVVTNGTGTNVSDAYNGVVVDDVPAGVVVDPASITRGGELTGADPVTGNGTITWDADDLPGPLAPGDSYVLDYQATLAPSATLTSDPLTNTATVENYESLPEGGRVYEGDEATATVTPAFPQLEIEKTTPDGSLTYIDDEFLWQIDVTNAGDGTAFDVAVTDRLPPSWEYVPGSATTSGPDVSGPVDPDVQADGTLSFTELGTLEPGETLTLTLRATPTDGVVDDPGVGSDVPHVNSTSATTVDATASPGNAEGPYGAGPATAEAFIDLADLEIAKTHGEDPVAGEDFDWTLAVSNNGPDTAVGPFTVTDTVEAPSTFVSATGDGWDCTATGPEVTCLRSDATEVLPRGESFPDITLTVAIPDDVPGGTELANTADVSGRTLELELGNNTDTDVAPITTEADLQIVKQTSGEIIAGQNATYTLNVTNLGPSVARADIVVTDAIPPGTTFVSASGDGWTCSADGTVTCVLPQDLAVGEAAPQIALVVAVPSDQVDDLENTAEVESTTTPDPDLSNNTDTVVDPVTRIADLALDKVSAGPLVAGEQGTYRFTVNNVGPSDAEPVVQITDTLPDGLTYVSSTSIDGDWACSAAGQDLTCDLAEGLPSGDTAIVEVTFDVDSAILGEILNVATVTTPTPEIDLENNTDDDSSEFTAEVDLAIDKSHVDEAIAGEEFDWTIEVTNNGPSDSAGPIAVSDGLPPGTSFVAASGDGWVCNVTDATVLCSRADGLPAGEAAPPITLTVLIAPDAGPAEIVNTATVQGPSPETNPDNNSDDDVIQVEDLVNLSLTKTTTGPDPVLAGEQTEFTIEVTNDGPSTADFVTVTDRLPEGLTIASIGGDGWECREPSSLVAVCQRPSLGPGEAAPPIVLTVDVGSGVADGTTLTNSAGVATPTPEEDRSDNTDTSDVTVVAEADLVIDKSHDTAQDPVLAGEQAVFDIAVTNNGPSDAQPPITVTDTLPEGLTYVSSTGPWTCAPAGQTVTCVLDGDAPLIAGTDAPPLGIRVGVDPDAEVGDYENSANVESPTPDPDPDNNTDIDVLPVGRLADIAVDKSHEGPVRVGDDVTFTIEVSNVGPSTARDVTFIDAVPAELTLVSAEGEGWTCSTAGQDVECLLDESLGVAETAPPISVTVTVLPEAYPSVVNVAEVSTSTPEQNLENNTNPDELVVPPLVDLAITKSHEDPVQVGEELVYTLEIVNNGPTPDPGPIAVVDNLPDGVAYVEASGDGWTCEQPVGQNQVVACASDQGLDVGETTTIDVTVDVLSSAYPEIINTAGVATESEETTLDNNLATDPAVVIPLVRLTIEKDVASQSDDQVVWDVSVTNLGPNDSVEPIVVTDPAAPGLEHVSASGPGWRCTVQSNGDVVCTYEDSLLVGETATFQVTSDITAGPDTEITNVVLVVGGGGVEICPDETGDGCSEEGSATATIATPPLVPPTTLPRTGAWIGLLAAAAIVLLATGGAALAYSRRLEVLG